MIRLIRLIRRVMLRPRAPRWSARGLIGALLMAGLPASPAMGTPIGFEAFGGTPGLPRVYTDAGDALVAFNLTVPDEASSCGVDLRIALRRESRPVSAFARRVNGCAGPRYGDQFQYGFYMGDKRTARYDICITASQRLEGGAVSRHRRCLRFHWSDSPGPY